MAKPMNKAEKDRILELYAKGFSTPCIARDLGRSKPTIRHFLAEQETLPERKERPKKEDLLKRDSENTPRCCKGCKHRRRIMGLRQSMTYCSYANDMAALGHLGEVRGCSPAYCTHYERGKPDNNLPEEWRTPV